MNFYLVVMVIMVTISTIRSEALFRQMGEIAHNIQLFEIRADIDTTEIQLQIQYMHQVLPSLREFVQYVENTDIIKTVNTNYRQLNTSIRAIETKFHNLRSLLNEVAPTRHQRSILATLGLVSIGSFLITSLFTYHQTNPALNRYIDITKIKIVENTRRIEYLNATLEEWWKHFHILDQEINDIEAMQKVLTLCTEMNTILDLLLNEVSDLEDGIISALHHEISPKLIAPTLALKILNEMKEALPRHMIPAVTNTHLAEFYSLPIRLFVSKNRIIFLTNIPAYNPNSILYLYHHVNIPLWSTKHNVTLIITSQKSFLAINADRTLHRELSTDEVDECHRIGQLYLCPQLRVLYKDDRSCLKALFLNNIETSQKICSVELSAKRISLATELTNNHFMIIEPEEERANLVCPDGKRDFPLRQGTNKLNLTTNCILSTPTLLINTLPEPINFLCTHLHPIPTLHLDNLDSLLQQRHKATTVDLSTEKILRILRRRIDSSEKVSIDELINSAANAEQYLTTESYLQLWIPITLSIISLGSVSALIFWLSYRYYLYQQRIRGHKRPSIPTPPELNPLPEDEPDDIELQPTTSTSTQVESIATSTTNIDTRLLE